MNLTTEDSYGNTGIIVSFSVKKECNLICALPTYLGKVMKMFDFQFSSSICTITVCRSLTGSLPSRCKTFNYVPT